DPAQSVLDAGNPLFSEQAPLPVLGTPIPIGVNFCVQLTDAQIDFHPGNVFALPPELGDLSVQRFALRAKACVGLDCPPKDFVDQLVPVLERIVVERQELVIGKVEEDRGPRQARLAQIGRVSATHGFRDISFGKVAVPAEEVLVLPTRELLCVCLELFAVGHLEWGSVVGSQQQWLKPRIDGIEIVDLEPKALENSIECYLVNMLRLGILPRLMVPMEKMILDITAMLREQGMAIGQQVTLQPSAVPGDVPNNPAIEQDQLKVFIKLTVTEGGA
ncbi:MAG: hypothetical protein OEM41_08875, partial [Ignavibacteria bacterium]|nr:hypothetical protein [Ignavibacteria bacterium]